MSSKIQVCLYNFYISSYRVRCVPGNFCFCFSILHLKKFLSDANVIFRLLQFKIRKG